MQHYDVEQLVPHAGRMSLLHTIEGYGEDWLEASAEISIDNPFISESGVPAWVGIEYMAQTVAAFAGRSALLAGDKVKVGFLLGTRRYNTDVPAFAMGTRLLMRVKQLMASEGGLNAFECTISGVQHERPFSCTASINVYQPNSIDDILRESL